MAQAKRDILPNEGLPCAKLPPMLFNRTSQYTQNNTGRQVKAKGTSLIRNNLDFYYSPAHLNADCWAKQTTQMKPSPFPLLQLHWVDGPTPAESLNLYAVQGINGALVVANVPD
jgi:hypothetical protein